MTRKWVKKELKKNPLERLIIKIIKFVRIHKNEVITGAGAVIILGLFIALTIRQRIQKNNEAGRIFAMAQADFQSRSYDEAIEKFNNINQRYPGAKIADMASYMKALAYSKQQEHDQARKVLQEAKARHEDSQLIHNMNFLLAKAHEDTLQYDEALENYRQIDPGHYLYPEALMGQALIHEITGKQERAVEIYRQAVSDYPHYIWAETASARLQALGESFEPAAAEDSGDMLPSPELEEPFEEPRAKP